MVKPVNAYKLLKQVVGCAAMLLAAMAPGPVAAQESTMPTIVYDPGQLKPVDSVLKVKVGDPAPTFSLPALTDETISLALSPYPISIGAPI